MDATQERWLPVAGYEGIYEVSDQGRVRSLDRISDRNHRLKGRVLKPWLNNPRPYPCVTFGHSDKRRIHRLVLETFVGRCPIGMEVLHANDDPADNRLVNLRWGTRSENKLDAVRNGIHPNAKKTCCKRGHDLADAYIKANGGRQCRPCQREAIRRSKAKKRLALGI